MTRIPFNPHAAHAVAVRWARPADRTLGRRCDRVLGPARSSREIAILLLVAVALGLADLALTGGMMATGGMFESNPLARLVASAGLPGLVAYKVALMTVHASVLWRLRARPSAIWVARGSVAVLVLVLIQWMLYMDAMRGLDRAALASVDPAQWVSFAGASRVDR